MRHFCKYELRHRVTVSKYLIYKFYQNCFFFFFRDKFTLYWVCAEQKSNCEQIYTYKNVRIPMSKCVCRFNFLGYYEKKNIFIRWFVYKFFWVKPSQLSLDETSQKTFNIVLASLKSKNWIDIKKKIPKTKKKKRKRGQLSIKHKTFNNF